MKLQVTQENFSKTLSTITRVAGGRTPSLPVLQNVLLKTVKNQLLIAATNLELAITQQIGAKVEQEGALTVPARLLNDFINSLPSGNIQLEATDNKLHITADQYSSTINGISAEEFPAIPTVQNGIKIILPGKTLSQGLQQTVLAASSDESRPVLTGVYLFNNGGKLTLTATDSYRLAEKQLLPSDESVSAIIPATTLQEIMRIIDDKEKVVIVTESGQSQFTIGDINIISRLIDGTYPEYQQLIPDEGETSFTINKNEFLNIAKVASLFARESAGSVTLKVSEGDNSVSITSIASQVGENTSTASAKVTGSGEVALNSRYLIDALNAFNDEEISLTFSGKLKPCVIKGTAKTGDYTHVVMPLKS